MLLLLLLLLLLECYELLILLKANWVVSHGKCQHGPLLFKDLLLLLRGQRVEHLLCHLWSLLLILYLLLLLNHWVALDAIVPRHARVQRIIVPAISSLSAAPASPPAPAAAPPYRAIAAPAPLTACGPFPSGSPLEMPLLGVLVVIVLLIRAFAVLQRPPVQPRRVVCLLLHILCGCRLAVLILMTLLTIALRTASVAPSHVIGTLVPRNSIEFVIVLICHVEGEDGGAIAGLLGVSWRLEKLS